MENNTNSIVLPGRVETGLEEIYKKHKCGPINDDTRVITMIIGDFRRDMCWYGVFGNTRQWRISAQSSALSFS
ncbi:unnamed protein product [Arabis nemorensis]|uniref:RDRP3-5 N-terminal domain-containing protein n=1 Tax=Arabis nemorensis TaxID=586526 RepID=A0A565BFW5_9BRAS|nr:unnamed protein product [Arabis nemorensis]VVA99779.1 unnamed protein product [Arabis nemorensis]